MRNCPLCNSDRHEVLFTFPLSSGEAQSVLACAQCEMVFSTIPTPADYGQNSIYALPDAIGSGGSPADKERLSGVADLLIRCKIPLTASILDIGCAQGGLLSALKDKGFTNLLGIDPSPFCVQRTAERGFRSSLGSLGCRHMPSTDLAILSHVIEHVANPLDAIRSLKSKLLYIEVPNAARYRDYQIPFLDFNSEHINHFDLGHLLNLISWSGYQPVHAGEREIRLTNGAPYPAIYALAAGKLTLSQSIHTYVKESKDALSVFNSNLERELEGESEVILWGAGEYMTFIAHLPIFNRVRIVQAVDRNPALHGHHACGVKIEPPSAITRNIPIVISTIIAIESIARDAQALGMGNKIVRLK